MDLASRIVLRVLHNVDFPELLGSERRLEVAAVFGAVVQQFQDLRDWEQSMILTSLERVAHMMDAQHIDASPVLDLGQLDRTDPGSH